MAAKKKIQPKRSRVAKKRTVSQVELVRLLELVDRLVGVQGADIENSRRASDQIMQLMTLITTMCAAMQSMSNVLEQYRVELDELERRSAQPLALAKPALSKADQMSKLRELIKTLGTAVGEVAKVVGILEK